MSANTNWNFAGTDFPAGGSARQKLGYALKYVSLASAMDEWQPWQFHLDNGHAALIVDAGPAPETVDPDGREMMTRCGAALFHLKLALKRFGSLGRVELFPDLDRPGLVARVHYGSGPNPGAAEVALFEAMAGGRNGSRSWAEMPVSESVLDLFQGAVAGEKAWLDFSQCESSRERLEALVEPRERAPTPEFHRETPDWNSRFAQWTRPLLTFVVRSGHAGNISVETTGPRAEEMAALAVIKTKTDDRYGWLAAGQALARVRLQARVLEIPLHVFDQACRNRYVREELRTSIGHKGFAQAIIGLGSSRTTWTDAMTADREVEPGVTSPLRLHFD